MEREAPQATATKKKGLLGVGIFGALAKGAALLFGHHAGMAVHAAEEAAPAFIHAAPAISQDVTTVAAHAPNLVEDAARGAGRAAANANRMSDAERIARSAADVAKGYARQKGRQMERDERNGSKTP